MSTSRAPAFDSAETLAYLEEHIVPTSQVPPQTRKAAEEALDRAAVELRIRRPALCISDWLSDGVCAELEILGSVLKLEVGGLISPIFLKVGLTPEEAQGIASHEARHALQEAAGVRRSDEDDADAFAERLCGPFPMARWRSGSWRGGDGRYFPHTAR